MSESKQVVTFTILIDGTAIPGSVQVTGVVVNREANRISTAKVMLLDGDAAAQDFPLSSGDLFVPGKELEIQVGYESDEASIFKGVITQQSIKIREGGPASLSVMCRDKAWVMTRGEHNRYFFEVTDADVLEELISGAGLSADISDTDSVDHPVLVQYQSTDWDFVVNRAEVNGSLVFTEDGTVRIATPDLGQGPVETVLQYGENLLAFDAEIDGRSQYEAVTGTSWDPANQEPVETEGSAPSENKHGNLDSGKLAGDLGVPDIALHHDGQVAETELTAWTSAKLLKSRLTRMRGTAKAQGSAEFLPDTVVTIQGLGDRYNGDAYLTGVQHEIMDGNWLTTVQFGMDEAWFSEQINRGSRGASGLLPPISGLQIGVVTQLEGDPDGEDRILVTMPMISPEEEGVWSRLATLDAGDSRGWVFRPEIGDEVILGFLNDDPRNAVVLGQVHSSAKPAPIPGSDDNHEKGLTTRDGMTVLFDDDKLDMTLATPGGNSVALSEDQGGIFLEDENGNKVTLNSDGITLESAKDIILSAPQGDVKIEGINVEVAAQANFKAEGSAGAEVSTSAVAVLKGSLVQIN